MLFRFVDGASLHRKVKSGGKFRKEKMSGLEYIV